MACKYPYTYIKKVRNTSTKIKQGKIKNMEEVL